MNDCGLLDLICHVQSAGDALFAWLLGFVSFGFLAGLVIGAFLGARYGWLAVVTLGLTALAVLMAQRPHDPQDHEHVPASSRDGVTPFRRPKPGKRHPPDAPTSLN